jgi:nucleoside triphosphate pyrophosphatase
MRLILASGSPRRALLLHAAGFVFTTIAPEIDETPHPGEAAAEYVLRLSEEKAQGVVPHPDVVVLAADTTVVCDGTILGKPTDRSEAIAMLEALSGVTHSVLTGWTILRASSVRFGVAETFVTFRKRTLSEIAEHVDRTEPYDKAGAYGIQGDDGWLISDVRGSRSNVMGLPLGEVVPALEELGVPRSAADG